VFEGPIDLLLHLVTSHRIDLLEVPLAPVVDAFVAHLTEEGEALSMDTLSEFLLVAAILLELKSQKLLPGPDAVEDEDELVGWDDRDLLLARLLECRAYAAIADRFVAMAEVASSSFARLSGLDDGFVVQAPDLLSGVSLEALARAYVQGTAELQEPQVDLSHVTVDAVTVSETVEALVIELPKRKSVSFRELTAHSSSRMDVIVHFLALLELCKMGKVSLGQGTTFGDLQVTWVADDRLLAVVGAREDLFDEYDG